MKILLIAVLLCVPAFAGERPALWLSFAEVDTLVVKLRSQRFPASEEEMLALIARQNPCEDLPGLLANSHTKRSFTIFLTDSKAPEGFFVFEFSMRGQGEYKSMLCESAKLEFCRYLPRDLKDNSLDRDYYTLESIFPKKKAQHGE